MVPPVDRGRDTCVGQGRGDYAAGCGEQQGEQELRSVGAEGGPAEVLGPRVVNRKSVRMFSSAFGSPFERAREGAAGVPDGHCWRARRRESD